MDATQIVVAVMDEWKAGIDAHDPDRVAAAFTHDTVFQGLRPYGVGREVVSAYYESQPAGMTVSYRVLEGRTLAADAVVGYLRATFEFVDQPPLDLNVGVALARVGEEWLVAQYQASRI
jgi:uncharacterized protein (TIGR02246 family)